MNRQPLIKRLKYLRNWEAVNIFFLPACMWFVLQTLQTHHWQPYAAAIFLICVVLAQGVVYWHLKLQTIRQGTPLPASFQRLYTFFKWLDAGLLALYPLLALLGSFTTVMDFQASIWSHLIYLFAILEYINYYFWQLSYDNCNDIRYLLKHRRLRRAHLYIDLKQARIAEKQDKLME